jgi:hypothetical protein
MWIVLLSLLSSSAVAYRAPEWQERIRTHALKMIDEAAAHQPSSSAFLAQARLRLTRARFAGTPAGKAYMSTPGTNEILIAEHVRFMPISMSAGILLHETGHLLGYGECDAEEAALSISRNSLSSTGITAVQYFNQCPALKQPLCGMPVLFQRPAPVLDETRTRRRQLKRQLKEARVTADNIDRHVYLANRIANWVGGPDSCTRNHDGDLNARFNLKLDAYIDGSWANPVLEFLVESRKDLVDRLSARLRR